MRCRGLAYGMLATCHTPQMAPGSHFMLNCCILKVASRQWWLGLFETLVWQIAAVEHRHGITWGARDGWNSDVSVSV